MRGYQDINDEIPPTLSCVRVRKIKLRFNEQAYVTMEILLI